MKTGFSLKLQQMLAAALLTLSLVTALGAISPAGATEMDKGAFKTGCQSTAGNSYVENNDGSFQCNLKDGGVIKCPDTKSQCSYTPARAIVIQPIRVPTGAVLQAFASGDTSSLDAPAPAAGHGHHKHHKHRS